MRIWVNGRLLDSPTEPALSVLDHGLVVGDGVFETIKIESGHPFALSAHLDRLCRSAHGLGLRSPDVTLLRIGVAATLKGESIDFGRIRITYTSGMGALGSPRGTAQPTAIVIAEAYAKPPPTTSIVTVPWGRNEKGAVAGLKTTSYAENALMIEHALARGASEAIMPNTVGNLCEGTGSNIFYVVDGQVRTPTLTSGCLAGVTRDLALRWCADDLDIVEVDEPIEVLQGVDEIFLAGTTRDLQGVERVDERPLSAPGPLTTAAQAVWARESVKNIDP